MDAVKHVVRAVGGTSSARQSRQAVQSPHPSPHLEKDQPSLAPTTAVTGNTAPPNAHTAHPQTAASKRPTRPTAADNSASGAHGQPVQTTQATQATQAAQPAQPTQAAQPIQAVRSTQAVRATQAVQPVQPPISGTDPRKIATEPAAPPRDREVPIQEREPEPNKRGVEPNKRGVESNKRVDSSKREADLAEHEAELVRIEAHLNRRLAHIQQQEADVKDRELRVIGQEAKLQHLESEPYRQELLSIRVHMQVNDLQEPWEISQRFNGITRKVEEISRNLGEKLFSAQPTRELATVDFAQVLPRWSSRSQPQAAPAQSVPLDPEDFIDFASRAFINDWLVTHIFGPGIFHPAMSPQENELFLNTYETIRKQESQVIAGRWRVSTFKAFSSHTHSHDELARQILERLSSICRQVYKSDVCSNAIDSISPSARELVERALTWTYMAKGSVVMLDFHPQFYAPGDHFDEQCAGLEGPKPKLPASKTILLTSKLGLLSSRAVEGVKHPEYSLQTKATVLATEYFM